MWKRKAEKEEKIFLRNIKAMRSLEIKYYESSWNKSRGWSLEKLIERLIRKLKKEIKGGFKGWYKGRNGKFKRRRKKREEEKKELLERMEFLGKSCVERYRGIERRIGLEKNEENGGNERWKRTL